LSGGDHGSGEPDDGPGPTAAHRIFAAMRRRESWLAWAGRQPDIDAADDPAHVAPYVRRLWVRVHGAETRATLPTSVDEVQAVIIGVYRSVLMDGRSRVRDTLTRAHGAA
jgi:hypothetical protein